MIRSSHYRLSYVFPTKDALDKYLDEHPGADRSLHTVDESAASPAVKEEPKAPENGKKPDEKEDGGKKTKNDVSKSKGEANKLRPLFNAEEDALPAKAFQPVQTQEEIYKQAEVAQNEMLDVLDRGKGIDKAIGAEHLEVGKVSMEDIDKRMDKPGPVLITAPIKGKKRATEKVSTDYKTKEHPEGDWSQLLDAVRASVAVDSVDDIEKTIGALRDAGIKFARKPKDRINKPTEVGYRDILLNIKYSNGHVGELQIHLKDMLKTKEREGHKHYETSRGITATLEKEGRKTMTDDEAKKFKEAEDSMKKLYGDSWDRITGAKEASLKQALKDETRYFRYRGQPAVIRPKELPTYFYGDKEQRMELFKFLNVAEKIDKAEFDKMMKEQKSGKKEDKNNDKKSSVVAQEQEVVELAKVLARDLR